MTEGSIAFASEPTRRPPEICDAVTPEFGGYASLRDARSRREWGQVAVMAGILRQRRADRDFAGLAGGPEGNQTFSTLLAPNPRKCRRNFVRTKS
jgi:hypothetical protein